MLEHLDPLALPFKQGPSEFTLLGGFLDSRLQRTIISLRGVIEGGTMRLALLLGLCFAVACSGATIDRFTYSTEHHEPPAVLLRDHPALTAAAIHVWVYEDDAGPLHIRVVGHANEDVCRQVSSALLLATADPAVNGFLTFGVAELAPATDRASFAEAV